MAHEDSSRGRSAVLIGVATAHVGRQRWCRAKSEEGKKGLGFDDSPWAAVDKDGNARGGDDHRWCTVTVCGVTRAQAGNRCVWLSGGAN
jgi:hypothetical protein